MLKGNEKQLEVIKTCGVCGATVDRHKVQVGQYTFVRGSGCGVVRLNPRLPSSALSDLYGEDYLHEIAAPEQVRTELLNPTFTHRRRNSERYTSDRSLFEIGCGDGSFLAYLKSRGWAVDGSEYTKESVQLVRRKIRTLLGSADLKVEAVRTYDPWHSPGTTASTARSIAAALVKRNPGPASMEVADYPRATLAAGRMAGRRQAAEKVLLSVARPISWLESLLGAGNVLDVVARK